MNNILEKILKSAELSGQRFSFSLSSHFRGFRNGTRLGNKTGQSLEFVEHREYQAGDDIRHLDWSAAARSDKLAIKLFKEEITPHIDVLVDLSASMAAYEMKFNSLAALAVILKKAAYNSGFSCDNWLIKNICKKVEPEGLPIELWEGFNADYRGDAGETIFSTLPKLRNGGVRIIISDLFWNIEPMAVLNRLSEGATVVVIIQVVAKADVSPDIYGNVRVIDSESGSALELVCDEELLKEYRNNFERHRQYWKECCSRVGAVFNFIVSENLLNEYIPDELIKNEVLKIKG